MTCPGALARSCAISSSSVESYVSTLRTVGDVYLWERMADSTFGVDGRIGDP